ncbi:hypothetical protein LIA77_09896 [Sarocladium implicatum]|nr:hypothetical protein LIA77_09896 [Sarocladium implicatum]
MPRQRAPQHGHQLSINVTESRYYYPGETVTGEITRQPPIAAEEVTLSIELRGSVTVQISQASNQSRLYHRQHAELWQPISQEVYRGPARFEAGAGEPCSRRFSVTLPMKADNELFKRVDHDARFFGPDDERAFELPPTFESGKGTGDEFLVEYVLTATLKDSRNTSIQAVLPVAIRRMSSQTPIYDFKLTPYRLMLGNVSSPLLIPSNNPSTSSSLTQKARHLFSSAAVPRLAYFLSVTYPAVLQIGHPEAIPFHVTAVMRKELTSKGVQEGDPALVVQRYRLRVEETTYAIAKGAFGPHIGSKRRKIMLVDWRAKKGEDGQQGMGSSAEVRGGTDPDVPGPSEQLAPAYYLNGGNSTHSVDRSSSSSRSSSTTETAEVNNSNYPDAPPDYEPRQTDQDEPPPPDLDTLIIPWDPTTLPLDLGKALDIRLPMTGTGLQSKQINSSFRSVFLKNTHKLKWEMEVCVVGEVCKFEGEHEVDVLGPSCDDVFS